MPRVKGRIDVSLRSASQQICPYCKDSLNGDEALVACRTCVTTHHDECWSSNGSRCSVFGCRGTHAIRTSLAIGRPVDAPAARKRTKGQQTESVRATREDLRFSIDVLPKSTPVLFKALCGVLGFALLASFVDGRSYGTTAIPLFAFLLGLVYYASRLRSSGTRIVVDRAGIRVERKNGTSRSMSDYAFALHRLEVVRRHSLVTRAIEEGEGAALYALSLRIRRRADDKVVHQLDFGAGYLEADLLAIADLAEVAVEEIGTDV